MSKQLKKQGTEFLNSTVTRRAFIKKVGLTAAGSSIMLSGLDAFCLTSNEAPKGWKPPVPNPKVKYRRLGRTKLMISEIVGSTPEMSPQIRALGLESGINYWHKADAGAGAEIFQKRPRESYYLDVVIDSLDKEGAIEEFEKRRHRCKTDYIDFFKVHSTWKTVEDFKTKRGVLQAYEALKKQGKARFLALSKHGPNVAEVLTAAIESDLFDAIQIAYSLGAGKAMDDVLAMAKKRDVGVILMKTMGGLKRMKKDPELMRKFGADGKPGRALLAYLLSLPSVTALVPAIKNFDQFDENIGASGKKVGYGEKQALKQYAAATTTDSCVSCGLCDSHCPQNVALSDIFRYRLYATGHGELTKARQLYAQLPVNQRSPACTDCGACEQACPSGLSVVAELQKAHALLA